MNADFTFHLALGMLAGSAVGLRQVLLQWLDRGRLAKPFLRWFGWCYGAGLFAVAPSLLRHLGLPESFCSSWWMNIFLFHPLIDRWLPQGKVIGGSLIILIAAVQYSLLLLAIQRAKKYSEND